MKIFILLSLFSSPLMAKVDYTKTDTFKWCKETFQAYRDQYALQIDQGFLMNKTFIALDTDLAVLVEKIENKDRSLFTDPANLYLFNVYQGTVKRYLTQNVVPTSIEFSNKELKPHMNNFFDICVEQIFKHLFDKIEDKKQ